MTSRDNSQPRVSQVTLGCIADDVTGATDLAINLSQGGMRVMQWLVIPSVDELRAHDVDAIVIALKTRSLQPQDAIDQSLRALEILREFGCSRFFFKYCSTFDSTEQGNIGPVAEVMMRALNVSQTIYCPAFPRAGRTVYQGHLFVHGNLLSESGMENHPLTPMRDANLMRFLSLQVEQSVGLVAYDDLKDVQTASSALEHHNANGVANVITDCCNEANLRTIADAVAEMPLVTGGSGIARFLPESYRRLGLLEESQQAASVPVVEGRSLVLSGSCSEATQAQVKQAEQSFGCWRLDVEEIVRNAKNYRARLLDWASESDPTCPLLVYSTSSNSMVQDIQDKVGQHTAARTIESFFADIARELVDRFGFRRIIVAGGETSGAVVNALGIRALRIGPEICAGVPWTESIGHPPLAMALKSGNFGNSRFFPDALEMLQ